MIATQGLMQNPIHSPTLSSVDEVSKSKHVPRTYELKSLGKFLILRLLSTVNPHFNIYRIITIDYVVVHICVFYDKAAI